MARAQAEALAAVRIRNQEGETRVLWTVIGMLVGRIIQVRRVV